jgi:hypothetical protein
MSAEANDFMATARKRFKVAVDASAENRISQLDDVRFAAGSPDNGWQWPDEIRNLRKDTTATDPMLTINKLPQHIKLITNEQRQNRPAGKVLPVDDKGDPEVAEIFNGIIRHVEVRSHADIAYSTACENQVTMGEGYWRILTEYCDETSFDQDIVIREIKNSFSVYLDPDGLRADSTGRKCMWGFITDDLPESEYKFQFPDAKSKADWDQSGLGNEYPGWWTGGTTVRIAEYFTIESVNKKLYLWADGSVSLEGDPETEARGPEKPAKTRTTTMRKVKWAKINGLEVLEGDEEKTGGKDWAGKYIPIIRVPGNEYIVDGKTWVSGVVRNAKDPQRMVNYWTSKEAAVLALAPKQPYMAAIEAIAGFESLYQTANTANHAYLPFNAFTEDGNLIPRPERVGMAMAPMGIINAKQGSADDLQATVGQYNPSIGAEAQEKSGVAIKARQRQADVGSYHYIDNLARAVCYSTEIIVDIAPKVMDTRRVARIVGIDGEPDTVTIDPDQQEAVREERDENGALQKFFNLNVGTYDVVATTGPSYTTKRIEAVEGMVTLTGANPDLWGVIGDLIVKNMDWPGAEEMAERIRKTIPPNLIEQPEEGDPEAQKAQLQQAAQALGQREAELNALAEQMQAGMAEAEKAGADAKTAKAAADVAASKVQSKVDELNAQQEALAAERREVDLAKRLAESEIARAQAESKLAISEAMQKAEKAIAAQQENQIAERLLGVENTLGKFEVQAQEP